MGDPNLVEGLLSDLWSPSGAVLLEESDDVDDVWMTAGLVSGRRDIMED